ITAQDVVAAATNDLIVAVATADLRITATGDDGVVARAAEDDRRLRQQWADGNRVVPSLPEDDYPRNVTGNEGHDDVLVLHDAEHALTSGLFLDDDHVVAIGAGDQKNVIARIVGVINDFRRAGLLIGLIGRKDVALRQA